MLLAPIPASASKKIFGPLKFLRNVEYAMMEKSLLTLALGLKKAGSFGGVFSDNESLGTRRLCTSLYYLCKFGLHHVVLLKMI